MENRTPPAQSTAIKMGAWGQTTSAPHGSEEAAIDPLLVHTLALQPFECKQCDISSCKCVCVGPTAQGRSTYRKKHVVGAL